MAEWRQKRFWDAVTIEGSDSGFQVLLDGRVIKTPAKAAFEIPSRALAEAAAEEWAAQEGHVRPDSMPITRAVNSAIDKVQPQRQAVLDLLLEYCDTDLLCYRAESPEGLVARQTKEWDPCLHWIRATFGVQMIAVAGVIHHPQPPDVVPCFRAYTESWSPFQITGLHDLVVLSGSFVLGLAVLEGHLGAEEAWRLSRLDEDWQAEQWGVDEEAAEMAEVKRADFLAAARFLESLSTG